MPLDGFVVGVLAQELQALLAGARINKIYQPDPKDLVFVVRAGGRTHNLLLSAHPANPRFYLTEQSFVNPQQPPLFCTVLRKHIEGGIIENIEQIDNERIVKIAISARDELGDLQQFSLVVEIMGRHSNIVLLNAQNTVLDAVTRVSPALSRYRQVLPGKAYISPPPQDKANPFELKFADFDQLYDAAAELPARDLANKLMGLSLPLAQELISRADSHSTESVWNSLDELLGTVQNRTYSPTIVSYKEKTDYSLIPLSHLGPTVKEYPSMNETLDYFYREKSLRDSIKQHGADLLKLLTNELQKNERKLGLLKQDLENAETADIYRLYGELITVHQQELVPRQASVELTNYYSETSEQITIALDPLKTANENAQAYFKKYTKLKNSRLHIEEQIEITLSENDYLELLIVQVENAGVGDLDEIREELIEAGYLKKRQTKQARRKKSTRPQLLTIKSSEGITILVGRNNTQNDYLTTKLAGPNDTWLHTKDIPGSHVVIRAQDFTEQTLREAAELAAYYSKARESSNVPVDYTLIRHVKKPSGAKPGYVTYDRQSTIYVTPDKEKIYRLETNK